MYIIIKIIVSEALFHSAVVLLLIEEGTKSILIPSSRLNTCQLGILINFN